MSYGLTMPRDDPAPVQPMQRIRYYLGRAEDALDSSTNALHQTPAVDAACRNEVVQDLAVLRSKLDILRTLMNGR
jgi:hypothetical protein